MIYRVSDVDVCGEDRQVRGHKQLDPKLRVVRPPKARVGDDTSAIVASSLFVGMLSPQFVSIMLKLDSL